MEKKKRILVITAAVAVLALLIGCVIWTVWSNNNVKLTTVTVRDQNLPYAFKDFKIAQVSDLHNSELWPQVIERLKEADPDIIVITGDLVDRDHPDIDAAMAFIVEAIQIADCFYITGNHEADLPEEDYNRLMDGLKQYYVNVMEDRQIQMHRGGQYIALVGHSWGETDQIGDLCDFDGYSILLSHQPEDFDNYVAGGYDLVLSGHAHGGQIRLPLIGGLYTPGQGLFPKYDAGMYSQGKTDMYVSCGIGNSSFPIRFNNQPEVVLIVLQPA